MIKLYVQNENYHFNGFLSGVLIDETNKKVALFSKEGIEENNIKLDDELKWLELDSFEMDAANNVKVKAKDFALYKWFYCLNVITIDQ